MPADPDANARPRAGTFFAASELKAMLPSITISLPVIFILWCVLACLALGWAMLAYPAMWAAVGLAFFALDRALASKSGRGEEASSS